MDREQAINQAFYQALNGNLTYNSVAVPVTDSITNNNQATNSPYVILDMQTALNELEGSFQMQSWKCDLTLCVMSKQAYSVSKAICNSIGEQIENIIIPAARLNGLIQQTGWQITNVLLKQVVFKEIKLDAGSYLPKMLTFSMRVVKTG